MKENLDAIDILIYVGKWIGGLLVGFLSFMARTFYKNYTALELRLSQVEQKQETDNLRSIGKNAEFIARFDALETKIEDKVSRVEELSDVKFKEIHRDLEQIKTSQERTINLLTELIRQHP